MSQSFKLPAYHPLKPYKFYLFIILTLAIPFFWVFVLIAIALKNKNVEENKPKYLFHFVKDHSVFEEVIDSKCLISLTGGRTYATSIFNPYLGVKFTDKGKEKYVIVIDNSAGLFKPIINGAFDYIKAWKWWKVFRSEWISINKKDIGLSIASDKILVEKKTYKRYNKDVRMSFKYYLEAMPQEINNTTVAIDRQKFWFGIGEGFMSLLSILIIFYVNIASVNFLILLSSSFIEWTPKFKSYFDWAMPSQDLFTIFSQNKLSFSICSVVGFCVFVALRLIYLKLRKYAILDRKILQKEENQLGK